MSSMHEGGGFVALLSKHIFMGKNEIKQFQLPWHSKSHGKAVTLTQSASMSFLLSVSASLFVEGFTHSTCNILLFFFFFFIRTNSFLDFKNRVTSLRKGWLDQLFQYMCTCSFTAALNKQIVGLHMFPLNKVGSI